MTDSSEIGVMQCKSWDTKYTNLHFFWSLGDLSRPYPEAHLGSGKDRSSATKMAGKRRGDGEYLKSEFKWPPPGAIGADGDQLMGNRGTRNGNLGMWPVQEENTHTQIHTISHNYTCICAVFEHEYIDNHWLIWCNHWLVWGKNTEVPSFSPLQPMNMRPMFIKLWAKRQEPPFTRWKKETCPVEASGIHGFPVLQKLPFQTTAGIGTGTPAMPTTQGTQEIRVKRNLYPTSSNSCVNEIYWKMTYSIL